MEGREGGKAGSIRSNAYGTGTYGASKAAMNILSETLRLELAPFGVGVNTIMTGAIETEIVTRNTSASGGFTLPPDSLYKSIKDIISDKANGGECWMGRSCRE